MCLYLKDINSQIARNDIVCYKVMFHNKQDNVICTPFRLVRPNADVLSGYANFRAEFAETPVEKLLEPIRLDSWFHTYNPEYPAQVGEGFIHTYMFASHAVEDMGTECFARKDYLLYRCVIPKGTEYLAGTYGAYPCYASREIRFEGIVD